MKSRAKKPGVRQATENAIIKSLALGQAFTTEQLIKWVRSANHPQAQSAKRGTSAAPSKQESHIKRALDRLHASGAVSLSGRDSEGRARWRLADKDGEKAKPNPGKIKMRRTARTRGHEKWDYGVDKNVTLSPRGRPKARYPFPVMGVGDSFFVSITDAAPESVSVSARLYATRWGQRYEARRVFDGATILGVRIWRMA